jgi:hypothetical protein
MGTVAGFRCHGDGTFSVPRPTEVWAVEYANARLERELAVMPSLNDAQEWIANLRRNSSANRGQPRQYQGRISA